MSRLTAKRLITSTPNSGLIIELLGAGGHTNGIYFTRDEIKYLQQAYGFDISKEENPLGRARSFTHMMRFVEEDGLRVMGVLSKYLEPNEDPVKFVLRLLGDAGYEVDPEISEWAYEEECDEGGTG